MTVGVAWRYVRYGGWLVGLINGIYVFVKNLGLDRDGFDAMMADSGNRFLFGITVVIAGSAGLLCLAYLVYATTDAFTDFDEDVVVQRTLAVVFGLLSIAVAAAAWALLYFS